MGQTLSEPVTVKNTTSDKDKNLIYAESCMQGWRLTMEDAHVCMLNLPHGEGTEEDCAFFCVFDGHGGQKVAQYASENIALVLQNQKTYKEGKYKDALYETYFTLDDNMRKLVPSVIDDNSGATAVSCLIAGNKLYCANSGDSRCIISSAGQAVPMSIDHKPSLKEEQERITNAGGFVDFGRVNGNLALSRAIGDFEFKNNHGLPPSLQVVTAKPDITEHDITKDTLFCVLACDGIWDCMSNQDVVDFIQSRIVEKKSLSLICEEIIDYCLAPDAYLGAVGCDNMSIIIIGFLHGESEEQWIERCEKTLIKDSGSAALTPNGSTATNVTTNMEIDASSDNGRNIVRSFMIYEDKLLITVGTDIVEREIESGKVIRTFRGHSAAIRDLALIEDTVLVSISSDFVIVSWDLVTGSITSRIQVRVNGDVQKIAISQGLAYFGGYSSVLWQVDMKTAAVLRRIQFNFESVDVVLTTDEYLFIGKQVDPHIVQHTIPDCRVFKRFLNGHTGSVLSIAINEVFLYSGSFDTNIVQWDRETATVLKVLRGHSSFVFSLCLIDDDLFSGSEDSMIFRWNAKTGEFIMHLQETVLFYHDLTVFMIREYGPYLFSGSFDGSIIKWNASSGDAMKLYKGPSTRLRDLARWSNFVITSGDSGLVKEWDLQDSGVTPFRVTDYIAPINCLFVNENRIFVGGSVYIIQERDLITNQLVMFYDQGSDATAVRMYFYNGKLCVANLMPRVSVFNTSTGLFDYAIEGQPEIVEHMAGFRDKLLVGEGATGARLWDIVSNSEIKYFPASSTRVLSDVHVTEFYIYFAKQGLSSISISTATLVAQRGKRIETSGLHVYTGMSIGEIIIWSVGTLEFLRTLKVHQDFVSGVVYDPLGFLYSSSFDGTVKKLNLGRNSLAFSFEDRTSSVNSLVADSFGLAVGLRSGELRVYSLSNSRIIETSASHSTDISSLVYANNSLYSSGLDGRFIEYPIANLSKSSVLKNDSSMPVRFLYLNQDILITLLGSNSLEFFSLPQRTMVKSIMISSWQLTCVAAANDLVFVGTSSGLILQLYSTDLITETFLSAHTGRVNDMVVIQNNLYSASSDRSIISWSLESLEVVAVFQRTSTQSLGHTGEVLVVRICGNALFSGGSDLSVRRWNLNTGMQSDVYLDHSKIVTALACFNNSLFSGSEDKAVFMYYISPDLLLIPRSSARRTTSTSRRALIRQLPNQSQLTSRSLIITIVAITSLIFAVMILSFFVLYIRRKLSKEGAVMDSSVTDFTDLRSITFVTERTAFNTFMGLSGRADLLMPIEFVAPVKQIARGGGGSLHVAKLMNPAYKSKYGEQVIQKFVFIRGVQSERAFYQEVAIIGSLMQYPNIVQMIGYTEKPPSIILKYYPSGSLESWLNDNKFTEITMLKIMREVSGAINTMHSHFLAHCDLKSANVLVEVDAKKLPTCYLTDFGITQVLSDVALAAKSFDVSIVKGVSIPYAAPEAISFFRKRHKGQPDFKLFDIFSLGCVFYEVTTRKQPWAV